MMAGRYAAERAKTRVREALWQVWTPLAAWAGRGYVAGPHLADALRVSDRMAQRGLRSTLCYWSPQGSNPEKVAAGYVEALRDSRFGAPERYLSIKAPEVAYSPRLLQNVAHAAAAVGARLHFDAHGPETADPTFAVLKEVWGDYPEIGCTLPGRWPRSVNDADLAVKLGLSVRVVKGQWRDPAGADRDLRRGFLDVVDRLAGRARHVAVASHDPVVARAALERLRSAGTSHELELLFGLPAEPAMRIAAEMGVPVRFYVPYGYGWLPYCFTQMRKNPRILWWLARDLVKRPAVWYREGEKVGRSHHAR